MGAELVAAIILGLGVAAPGAQEDQASADWVDRHRDVAIERLLPLNRESQPAAVDEWIVTVRVQPAFLPEGLVEIKKAWTGGTSVTVIALQGKQAVSQLADLHRKSPAASFDQLLGSVSTRKEQLSAERCPVLRRLLESLGRLSVPATLSSDIEMDATRFEILSRTRTNVMELTICGPTGAALDGWLRDAERLIEGGCATE